MDAINSHLLQKNRWLKNIAEDGKVLQMSDEQMQFLLDGDENGNVYSIMSINRALSLPIFCQKHDQKFFRPFEVKELDLNDEVHFLKLSYRAFCAKLAQEVRRNMFYNINPTINTMCRGELFDEQRAYSNSTISVFDDYGKMLFVDAKSKNVSNYVFHVVKMPHISICLSDVIFQESDLWMSTQNIEQKPLLYPIFVHALPYNDESVLIFGYDKRQSNERVQTMIDGWISCADKKLILDEWLVKTNNWCVAPSYFGESVELACEDLMEMKLEY